MRRGFAAATAATAAALHGRGRDELHWRGGDWDWGWIGTRLEGVGVQLPLSYPALFVSPPP